MVLANGKSSIMYTEASPIGDASFLYNQGGMSIEVKVPKALRPKGQKVNSGLKPIRGKQESRSQKRLPLSCFFLAGSFARRTDKIFEKISKQSKKFVFITILCCTVYNRRFKRRTFRFSKYPGWRKRTKRGRRFLVAPVQFAR